MSTAWVQVSVVVLELTSCKLHDLVWSLGFFAGWAKSRIAPKVLVSIARYNTSKYCYHLGGLSLVAQLVKNPPAMGDLGSIPGLGRSPGKGNGNPLQYSCLRIPWTEEPGRLQSMGSQE